MAKSTISSIKKKTVNFTWEPQGKGSYLSAGVQTSISKDRIISVIIDTNSVNAGAFITHIFGSGDIGLAIFQIVNIAATELTGSVTVFYR